MGSGRVGCRRSQRRPPRCLQHCLAAGYRKADLTVVYSLARGSGPLQSSLVAIGFLGEQISALGGIGIAVVAGGVFLVAGGPDVFRQANDSLQRVHLRKALTYGLLTGVLIASYTVLDGYSVKVLLRSPILLDDVGNFPRLAFFATCYIARPVRCGRSSVNTLCESV